MNKSTDWLKTGLMMLACPGGAFLGYCFTALFVANPLLLFVRAAMERSALSEPASEILVGIILALTAGGAGAGFIFSGRKTLPKELSHRFLAVYFIVTSLVLLLPEVAQYPVECPGYWFGFIFGGVVAALWKRNGRKESNSESTASIKSPSI